MAGDLNAGYVGALLEQYLENPEAVDPAWRELFERSDDAVLSALPGLSRLVDVRAADGGNGAATVVSASGARARARRSCPEPQPTAPTEPPISISWPPSRLPCRS